MTAGRNNAGIRVAFTSVIGTSPDYRKIIAAIGARPAEMVNVTLREVLRAVENNQVDAALIPCVREDFGRLAVAARALWEADLFIVREFTDARALLLAREPAPAVGDVCAVGGVAEASAVAGIKALFARENVPVRDFFTFPEFAKPLSTRKNLWVNFRGSLNNLPEQRALSAFETLTSGYRFFGNFSEE